jgi:hypothetical protein
MVITLFSPEHNVALRAGELRARPALVGGAQKAATVTIICTKIPREKYSDQ